MSKGSGGGASSGRGTGAAKGGSSAPSSIARPVPKKLQDAFQDTAGNKAFAGALSASELAGLREYTGDQYRPLNAALRSGDLGGLSAKQRSIISAIDNGLSKARVEKDVLVYRGLNNPNQYAYFKGGARKGDVYRDKGFMSTSIQRSVSGNFSGFKNERVLLRISVPKGSKAGYLGTNKLSRMSHEKELLLPRNSGLKIGKIRRLKGGLIIVNATLVE